MKNKSTVEINGQQYYLTGKATPNHMKKVAGFVDDKMKQISQSNPKLDANRLAVLSAVNIADQYLQLKQEYEEIMCLVNDEQP
jgi:cell division protein ZapA